MCYHISNLRSYEEVNTDLIRTNELRGVIVKNGYTQAEIANIIGISPKTFYEKMKIGVFGSDEIQIMINTLNIEDPASIFFAKE